MPVTTDNHAGFSFGISAIDILSIPPHFVKKGLIQMKFTPEVVAALAVLRANAENDFERHRINVLERDLTAPPVVEVIDDTHQRFNGVVYHKSNGGHFLYSNMIHRDVWRYCCGEIPTGCEIHHDNENKADNTILNLQLLTKEEHRALHNRRSSKSISEKVCLLCGKSFVPEKPSVKYCSRECYYKSRLVNRVEKICPICGKKFSVERKFSAQRYCSRQCAGKAITIHNPNKVCPVCGKAFTVTGSHTKQLCCSHSCGAKLWRQKNQINNKPLSS